MKIQPTRSHVVLILAAMAALAIAFHVRVVAMLGSASAGPGIRFASIGDYLVFLTRDAGFTVWDLLLPGLIAVLFLVLVGLETGWGLVSDMMRAICRREATARLAVVMLSAILVRYYIAGGQLWTADASVHACYSWITWVAFSSGEWPVWTNYLGSGTPFLQFYGFTFFYLTGFLNLFLQDLFTSIKVVLFAAHVVSGFTAYVFVRGLCRSRQAGIVAGLGYVLCFWHTQHVLVMGRLPLSVFYALLPLPFYLFERSRETGSLLVGTSGALSLAALVFTHPGFGFWAVLLLGVYCVLRTALLDPVERRRSIVSAAWVLVGGALFSAPLTVPMWLEREATMLRMGFDMSQNPSPTWHHLLVWSNYTVNLFPRPEGQEHWYGGYLGISLVGIAVLGTVASLVRYWRGRHRHRADAVLPLAGGLLLCLTIIVGYRWPILGDLSIVRALNPGRYLLFVTFFLACLAGASSQILPALLPRRFRASVPAAAALLVVCDLGPTTFRFAYMPDIRAWPIKARGGYVSLIDQHPDRRDPNVLPQSRTLALTGGGYELMPNAWIVTRTNWPSSSALYNESPMTVYLMAMPLDRVMTRQVLQSDPEQLTLTPDVVSALYLSNIRYTATSELGGPEAFDYRAWQSVHASPVVASGRIETWVEADAEVDLEARLRRLMNAMCIDVGRASCAMIPVVSEVSRDLGTSPTAEVLEHMVLNQSARLRLRVSEDCFLRLAYSYYPTLEVRVDGSRVEPMRTVDGFLAMELPAGEHEITLRGLTSALRTWLFAGAGLTLCATLGVSVRRRPNRATRKNEEHEI